MVNCLEEVKTVNFKRLELKDREWINQRLKEFNFRGCEFSFANNFIWSSSNNISFANINNFYCLKSEVKDSICYTYPAGMGDIKPVILSLIENCKREGKQFLLRAISEENLEVLKNIFPDMFEYDLPRDECDYIYSVEKLSTLSGKKYHGKRNHIARFKDLGEWTFANINEDNIDECIKMNDEWCRQYTCISHSLESELCAVKCAFDNFFKLNLTGGFIRLNGRVVAYTIGEPLTDDTYVIHIEKAFSDIQGAYPMINQQFLLHNCQGYKYVNREEDMGDEGLRKAKLSYKPEILLNKYVARLKVQL